jgi:hypothetical protein
MKNVVVGMALLLLSSGVYAQEQEDCKIEDWRAYPRGAT